MGAKVHFFLVSLAVRNFGSIILFLDTGRESITMKKYLMKKNKTVKKKFETEILDNLGIKWRHKKVWD